MKIVFDPSDFDEHFGAFENLLPTLDYCWTLEAMKQVDGTLTATFHDVRRGAAFPIVGAIDVNVDAEATDTVTDDASLNPRETERKD